MFDMRFLLPDLMEDNELPTAYALERFSKGALPITTATRLVKAGYRPKRIDLDTLDVLCRIFGVGPDKLLERDDVPATSPPRKRKRKAA